MLRYLATISLFITWPVLAWAGPVEWELAKKNGTLGDYDINGPLTDQVYLHRPSSWAPSYELAPQYPQDFDPGKQPLPNARIPDHGVVRAIDSKTRFNDEDARYRISFHLSHYGGMPESAGDFNGDGIEDFVNMSHFAYAKGKTYAGEVHVWFGRRSVIDPRTEIPDVVFYGDQANAKLGISVASAGDFNGDGKDDLMMSAAFYREDQGDDLKNAGGRVYIVYGGHLQDDKIDDRTAQIEISEIGKSVPGMVLRGGYDGSRVIAWANGLESGDFNGDGVSDIIIGSYDPYDKGLFKDLLARAYIVFGSRLAPEFDPDFRLGVPGQNKDVIQASIILPDHAITNGSLAFGASFIGDVNGDGRDEIALSAGLYGPDKGGQSFIFWGSPNRFAPDEQIPVDSADMKISADNGWSKPDPARNIEIWGKGLEQVRPVADFNCDGRKDFLVTARRTAIRQDGATLTTGGAAIFFGRSEWPSQLSISKADAWIVDRFAGFAGHPAVDRQVDISGDGCADILVNDPYFVEPITATSSQWRGRVWLLEGAKTPKRLYVVEDDAGLTFLANNRYPGMFGYTWQTGDWNGDGRYDIVIGDHYEGDANETQHSGVTYMFYNGIDFSLD